MSKTGEKFFLFFIFCVISALMFIFIELVEMTPKKEHDPEMVKLFQTWTDDVQLFAKAHPERFAAYNMTSMQCTMSLDPYEVNEQAKMLPAVKCQVEDKRGVQVDFSRQFMEVLIAVRFNGHSNVSFNAGGF